MPFGFIVMINECMQAKQAKAAPEPPKPAPVDDEAGMKLLVCALLLVISTTIKLLFPAPSEGARVPNWISAKAAA